MSTEGIAEAVDAISRSWAVPAATIAIADRTGLVFEHAYGFADLERGIPATPDHLFEIGSISKILTSTVVLRLVDEGRLALGDPASKYLPGLPGPLASKEVTVERMLSHSAGLVSGIDAVPDQAAQVYGFTGLRSDAAGDLFHYSNLGFILLGLIVQRITGRGLAEHVQAGILDAVGAVDSRPIVTFDDHARFAIGYQPRFEDRPWLPGDELAVSPFLEVDGADGCIAMPARDLAVFGRLLLAGGVADDGTRVLSPAGFEAMTTRLANGGEDLLGVRGIPASDETRYGLGINVERRGETRVLSHGGGMIGYATFLLVDEAAGISVAALTSANGDGPIAEALARTAAAIYTGTAGGPLSSLDAGRWSTLATDVDRETGAVRPRFIEPGMLGTFVGAAGALTVAAEPVAESDATLTVTLAGESAPLEWDWGPRALTRLPALARYPLQFDGANWTSGAQVFRPEGATAPPASGPDADLAQFCGRFRTYNPWFTNFRIVDREGRLVLVATPGVEAPSEDIPLVRIADRTFRMGIDPRLPDALVFGPAVGGSAQWVDRNGCRYSRSFVP